MLSLSPSIYQLSFALVLLALVRVNVGAQTPPACQVTYTAPARILDCSHDSQVLGDGQPEQRFFRLFLPPDYDQATDAQGNPKRYAVVYFFHGWGQRYNQASSLVGNYDTGDDRYGNDNLAFYVGQNTNLIIVKWDGFNPRYPGDTNPKPYNIDQVVTHRQFPLYFPELVQYIDAHLRTIADRDHRGLSGLSMGGFMSFWVSGKYPHLVGSASSFMPSTELFAGPLVFPTEYSHTPMYRNYEGLYTRLIMGTQDFIRWYHRRMNAIWDFTRPNAYHEVEIFDAPHGTPGIAKTLDFHMHAFNNPLPQPEVWHHADIYPNFDVWGYAISSNRQQPGFTVLENVSTTGFRSSVREWLPDGTLLPSVTLTITTDTVYVPAGHYSITDVNLDSGRVVQAQQTADASGRLTFTVSGDRYEIGISPMQPLVPIVTVADWRLTEESTLPINGKPVNVKLKFLNKGQVSATGWSAQVTSDPQVALPQGSLTVPSLPAGTAGEADLQFQVNDATREIVRLDVHIVDSDGRSVLVPVEIPVFADLPALSNLVLNDGTPITMWEHATNKTPKALGVGNRDGVANPGETVALLLPDGGAYRGGEMFTFDPCVDRSARLSDSWGDYDDVGASVKYSLPVISASCPSGHQITFFVRYQIPNKPEHILLEGIVKVAIPSLDALRFCCKDFNADGQADILWRHTSGLVYEWLLNGTSVSGQGSPSSASTDWQIVGVGDFNADGQADILWRHISGALYIWLLNGTSVSGQGSPGSVGTDWQVVGVGDFNGDGQADILWRHTSGIVHEWLLNGTSVSGQGSPGSAGTDWQIVGVGDFNGDGQADILWRHTSGGLYIWLLNGTSISGQGSPGSAGTDWQIVGVGDFNGDHNADILWRHSSGSLYEWLLNGTSVIGQGSPGAVSTDWQIQ